MAVLHRFCRERSGLVVECLTRDREAAGSNLTGVTALCPWARHIYSTLELVQPRKTCPCLIERLLMGRKESKQTNQNQLSLNAGQKYCKMLQREHSAKLMTFIKLPFVIIEIFVLSIFEWPFYTGFTVCQAWDFSVFWQISNFLKSKL